MPLCFWPGGEAANPDALHPGKARESSVGESSLSPSDVPGLSWARSPQTFRNPSAAGGTCLLLSTTLFRQLRVQGPQDPGAGLGARSPQRSLFLCLKIVLENTTVSYLENERYKATGKRHQAEQSPCLVFIFVPFAHLTHNAIRLLFYGQRAFGRTPCAWPGVPGVRPGRGRRRRKPGRGSGR